MKYISFFLMFSALSGMLNAQHQRFDYRKAWENIDKLYSEYRLPESGAAEIQKIYEIALREKRYDQMLKIASFRSAVNYNNDDFMATIESLKRDAEIIPFPAQAGIQSLLAKAYWSYYQHNRWVVNQRTPVSEHAIPDDIALWDTRTMMNEVLRMFKLSLNRAEELQQISVDVFREILRGDMETKEFRPTLYDLLLARALEVFADSQTGLSRPQESFAMDKPEYFADAETFANCLIPKVDTLSMLYQTLKLHQERIKFRLTSGEPAPLVDAEILRLRFVRQHYLGEDKDTLCEKALQSLADKYSSDKTAGDVLYELAYLYKTQGDTKKPEFANRFVESLKLCEQIQTKYPECQAAKESYYLNELVKNIHTPSLSITAEKFVLPQEAIRFLVQYRNIDTMKLSLYKFETWEVNDFASIDRGYDLKNRNIIKSRKKLIERQFILPSKLDYQARSTEIALDALPAGMYVVVVANENDEIEHISSFQVTNLSLTSDAEIETLALYHRKTGEALQNVSIKLYATKDWSKPVGSLIKTLYSNKNGKANISSDKDNYLSCALLESKGETVYIPQVQYFTQNKHQPGSEVYMFTDRAIYRPGQTVFFKGLVLDKTVEKTEINTEKQTVTVCLRDVNSKEIAKADFKVNEYGTFNGNFAIPQGLLNGVMRLETVGKHAYNNHTIRVEEYKRPTFEVKIKAPKQEIAMNSSISLKATAKALAGYAIDGAAVKYEVTRTAVMPFWRYYFMPYPYSAATQRQIASGTATTNENGEFTIDFVTKADDVKIDELIYNFTVTATVTDLNGETRSANYVLKASKKPLLIEAEIPDYIDVASKTNFGLKTTNLNGDSVSCRIEIKAERLKTPSRITRKRLWQTPDTMLMSRSEFERLFPYDLYMDEEALPNKLPVIEEVGSFSLNTSEDKEIDLSFLKKYPSGSYKITIKAVSDKGITSETPFYLQSVNGVPNVITRMENWLRKPLETNVKSGETVEFFLAGGDKNARVEYILFNKFAKIIERRTLTPGHTPQKLSIPIKKEYGNKITACFFMVHENRMYNDRTNIWISDTDNQLDITFASFRDKLQPGENEKWTLTIKDKKGDPQLAELVASMYDASLDAFAKHSWKEVLNIFDRFYWSFDLSSSNLNILSGGFNLKRPSTPYFAHPLKRDYINFSKTNEHYYFGSDERLDEVTIVGFGAQRKSSVVGSVGSTSAVSSRSLSVPLSETSKALAGNAYGLMDEASNYENEENMPPVETDEPVLARTNFNETAFFYPELRTNKDGEVVIEFTVPESLTRWKMLGMAHTRDLKIGLVERELITQKEVAISANAPRFFRQGDTLIFTAKVNNITKEKIKGFAEFEFFDALDMQPVDIADEKGSTPFEVDAYQSVVLQKRLIIPEGLQAVTYRVSARAGNHTDGEEKTVPVLTDRILVTESMPFSIRGNQEKSFVFDRLKNQSNTARNHALTLEYTSNPAWYAVQALPYIMEYPYECAEQTFARYYANALASNLMDASPKIKKIFELWKTLPEGKALASNLEKNQELKQALLEETPWALDASNETERKKRIGLLFDLNRMSSESSRALGKLQKMQSSTGGFSWFDGMPDDRYITQHIIVGLRHLEHLTSQNDKVCNEIISKAMNYLDKKIDEDYALDIKHKNADEKTIGISPLQMQYLYLCSFDKRTLKDSKAYDFYMNLAAKQWNKLGIYKQGLAALIMHRAGKGETAQAIVKSLKERARKSEEMGMYWESNRQGYFWYQAPTETQALMIEVFGEVANDAQAVEELRIWLLKNKQTCDWRTTKATSDAIYALLNTPGQPSERAVNLLDGKDVKIKIAGKALTDMLPDELKPEPGTGYVKASWRGEEVKKEMAEIEVSNPNSGIAWGAMYLQYFERLDKITASETKLGLKRKLFVKKQTESGPVLVPIAKQSPKVGDLITVRIELRADRDFEYVHLKDARAAGLEPASFASGYRHQEGLWYYQSMKDASQNFFIGRLLKGVYLFEYDLRVTHRGSFSHGISTIQCMYAPEFTSHSEGVRVNNLDE